MVITFSFVCFLKKILFSTLYNTLFSTLMVVHGEPVLKVSTSVNMENP